MKKNLFKALTLILAIISGFLIYFLINASQVKNSINLPPYSYTDLEYGLDYITVAGTLTSDGDTGIASELNTNEFTCDRARGTCELVQAELFDDNFLNVYAETFNIESWDSNFIVFKTQSINALSCVAWTYRIDRIKKELIGVRERASGYDHDRCMGIGSEKFMVKVVNGWDVVKKLRGFK